MQEYLEELDEKLEALQSIQRSIEGDVESLKIAINYIRRELAEKLDEDE